jgi:hypothetical protein
MGTLSVKDARYQTFTQDIEMESFDVGHSFPPGWAIRLKKGEMYGAKYVTIFRDEIRDMFSRGEYNKAYKIGPGRILKSLRARYPDRFDLPTENEIRQEISKLKHRVNPHTLALAEASKFLDGAQDISSSANEPSRFWESLLSEYLHIKPNDALVRFRAAFANSTLTDKQVKAKLNNLKTKLRKQTTQ